MSALDYLEQLEKALKACKIQDKDEFMLLNIIANIRDELKELG